MAENGKNKENFSWNCFACEAAAALRIEESSKR
jgi:hypothetical protein